MTSAPMMMTTTTTAKVCAGLSAALSAFLFAGAGPVRAQTRDASTIEDIPLEDLLGGESSVASTKNVQMRASPGAVSVLTREDIDRLGARFLDEVFPFVPGFDLAFDIDGVAGVAMRGNWAHEGKVLVLVDGIEVNETIYLEVPLGGHVPLDDVDKIEFLRGPGSARYGGMAELAVISITTRSGTAKRGVEADAFYAAGQTLLSNGGLSVATGGTLDAAGGLDLSLHASASTIQRSERRFTDVYGDSIDMEGSAMQQLWLNAAFSAPWLRGRLLVDSYSVQDRAGIDAVLPRYTSWGFPAAYLELEAPLSLTANLDVTPRLVVQRQLPWWSFLEDGSPDAWRMATDRARADVTATWQVLPTLHLSGGLSGYLDLVRAITGDVAVREIDYLDTNWVGDDVTQIVNGGVWCEASVDTPLVLVTAGARAEINNLYGPSFVPRVALTRVFDHGHAKLLVSGAFKAPSSANLIANPEIQSEHTRVLEAELGIEPFEGAYVVANAFDVEIRDPIVYFYVSQELDGYANYPRMGTRGVELELFWAPGFGRLDVSWSYATATDIQVPQYRVPGHPERMLGMPEHKLAGSFSLFLHDRVTLTPSFVLRSARGAVTAVDADGASVFTDLPPSALVNVFLQVRPVTGLSLGVGVSNVLDDPYALPQAYDSQHAPVPTSDRQLQLRIGGEVPW